tara:strand:- start:33 stop:146 length:114 start_codon:yes stop_codon:yes gene_type:complete
MSRYSTVKTALFEFIAVLAMMAGGYSLLLTAYAFGYN